jgi:hypothetical protein
VDVLRALLELRERSEALAGAREPGVSDLEQD